MEPCLTTILVEVKLTRKNLAGSKLGPKLVFCRFLKVASLLFLDIAQEFSLGQCLTSSRGETSKVVAQIRT